MNTIFSHSGASFELTKSGTIVKYALDIYHSANKQLSFNTNRIFNTPFIFDIRQHCFEMEYLKDSLTLSEYFNFITEGEICTIVDKVVNFVKYNITYHLHYDGVIFSKKVNDIILRLSKQEHLEAAMLILKLINKYKVFRVIGGNYHGDLTFSNILISVNRSPFLIDFLPGYIQSVELDYVKLLQECKLKWSALLSQPLPLGNNYHIACDYLMQQVKKIYIPATPIIEAINYLRILPYVKNDAIGTVLCNEIKSLIQ